MVKLVQTCLLVDYLNLWLACHLQMSLWKEFAFDTVSDINSRGQDVQIDDTQHVLKTFPINYSITLSISKSTIAHYWIPLRYWNCISKKIEIFIFHSSLCNSLCTCVTSSSGCTLVKPLGLLTNNDWCETWWLYKFTVSPLKIFSSFFPLQNLDSTSQQNHINNSKHYHSLDTSEDHLIHCRQETAPYPSPMFVLIFIWFTHG